MRKVKLLAVVLLGLAPVLVGCGDDDDAGAGDAARPDGGAAGDAALTADGALMVDAAPDATTVVPAGARVLAFEVNHPAGFDHAQQITVAESAGAGGLPLTMPWAFLEPDVGMRDVSFLRFGMDFYRARGLAVLLTIPTVDTVALLLPADLRAPIEAGTLRLDAASVIMRFEALLDAAIAATGTELSYLAIANEVDIHLANKSPAYWDAFTNFFAAGVARAHLARPGLKVGLSITHGGMTGADRTRLAALAARGDVVFATYYKAGNFGAPPVGSFATHLGEMVTFAAGKPLIMKELGYATGPALGGTEAGQSSFWAEVFTAWDARAAAVPYLMVSRMFDGARADCEADAASYGLAGNEAFIQFLCSLGVRSVTNLAKPAWNTISAAAAARGF